MKREGLLGFIDTEGKVVVKPQYSEINRFGEYQKTWALVQRNGLWGFLDNMGKEAVKPQYKTIEFGEDLEKYKGEKK